MPENSFSAGEYSPLGTIYRPAWYTHHIVSEPDQDKLLLPEEWTPELTAACPLIYK